MGDPFDKSAKDRTAGSGKQIMTAVVLGAAFLGVLAFQFRSQPRTAEAGGLVPPIVGIGSAPINAESASQAIALLADDPTAKLLRGTVEGPSDLDDVPTNPFLFSPHWRAKLTKAPPPKNYVPAPVAHGDNSPAFDTSHLQVTMILKQGTGYLAIVNGKPTFAGAIIAGAKIVEIRADRLICTQVAHPTAPAFEIHISKPK